MTDYERICDFQILYNAHKVARLGKRNTKEVIDFELNLSENLTSLSTNLKNKTYRMSGYYDFTIHDPKTRKIHALHYVDRVVQHALCDEVLAPLLERRLIYDNAACRIGKGTHFAISRVSLFLQKHYKKHGATGYILKCDIKKFFENIDHNVLMEKLRHVVKDNDVLNLLFLIINSFESSKNKGLPMGNQTSQWFAIYYLDGFDRLIKEDLQIKYYSRYMDDCVLIHRDKEYLEKCLLLMSKYINENLNLRFNSKTQIFPIKNGVKYLGWHFYLSENGKIIRKVTQQTKYKYKRKLSNLQKSYYNANISLDDAKQVLSSYHAHLSYGHTYQMQRRALSNFVLKKGV